MRVSLCVCIAIFRQNSGIIYKIQYQPYQNYLKDNDNLHDCGTGGRSENLHNHILLGVPYLRTDNLKHADIVHDKTPPIRENECKKFFEFGAHPLRV